MMRNLVRGVVLALTFTVLACDGSLPTASVPADLAARHSGGSGSGGGGGGGGGAGTPSGGGSITFVTTASGAPALASTVMSFYAVQGQDRIAEIFYLPSGNGGAHRFLRFQVRKSTQIVRPDGSALAKGDSILITMTVIDPTHLITQFEPAGLRFLGGGSARLTMSYAEIDPDVNHDGVVNAADAAIIASFSIFCQENATAPWIRIATAALPGSSEVDATIGGFTNYVIAY